MRLRILALSENEPSMCQLDYARDCITSRWSGAVWPKVGAKRSRIPENQIFDTENHYLMILIIFLVQVLCYVATSWFAIRSSALTSAE